MIINLYSIEIHLLLCLYIYKNMINYFALVLNMNMIY